MSAELTLYPWQQAMWASWQQLLAQQRLHHAMLLLGNKGCGRHKLAHLLARTLLCTNSKLQTLPQACGHCHACMLVSANTHPDLHVVAPEAENKRIGIDAIRQAMHYAHQSSQLGSKRVILISAADKLTEAAANALLKTLEEPPPNCHFILLAHASETMLPTVISRCNKWKQPTVAPYQIKSWLEAELMATVPWWVVHLHRDSPLTAKDFITQGQSGFYTAFILKMHDVFVERQGLFELVGVMQQNLALSLQGLVLFVLDIIKVQQGIAALVHDEFHSQLVSLARLKSPLEWLALVKQLNQVNVQLTTHSGLNIELLLADALRCGIES